jgi:hypothetical protein
MFAFIKYLESLGDKLKRKKGYWFLFLGVASFLIAIVSIIFINTLSDRYADDVFKKVKVELVTNLDTILEMKQQQISIANDLLARDETITSLLIAKKPEEVVPVVDIQESPDEIEDENGTISLEEIDEGPDKTNVESALKEDLLKRKERAKVTLSETAQAIQKSYGTQAFELQLFDKEGKLFATTDSRQNFDAESALEDSVQNSIVAGKPTYGIDVEQGGVYLRYAVPVTQDGGMLGTLMMMQKVFHLKEKIEIDGNKFAFLLHKDHLNLLSKAQSKVHKELMDDYYINPANYNSDFMFNITTIDKKELFEQGYVIDDHYYITYTTIQNFKGKDIGIAVIGQNNEQASSVIETIDSAVKNIAVIMLALVTSLFLLIV